MKTLLKVKTLLKGKTLLKEKILGDFGSGSQALLAQKRVTLGQVPKPFLMRAETKPFGLAQ